MVNVDHLKPQFAFYLEALILLAYVSHVREKEEIMFSTAFARIRAFVDRIAAPARANELDLLQLYRLSRGSDSVRPAVIRLLATNAAP